MQSSKKYSDDGVRETLSKLSITLSDTEFTCQRSFLHVGMFCLNACLCKSCVHCLKRPQEVISSSGPGVQKIVRSHVGAKSEIQVVWKSSQFS